MEDWEREKLKSLIFFASKFLVVFLSTVICFVVLVCLFGCMLI